MSFQKKNVQDVTVGLSHVESSLIKLEDDISKMRRQASFELEQARKFTEERNRENEQYQYDLRMDRKQELDRQAAEDKARDEAHNKRSASLAENEKALADLLGLTNYTPSETGRKAIEQAFNAKLDQTAKAAESKAFTIAKKEADQAKALADAQSKTDLELLKQRNHQLMTENVELKKQNELLIQASTTNSAHIKDIATKGLEAAGALNGRGQQALETAATAGSSARARG